MMRFATSSGFAAKLKPNTLQKFTKAFSHARSMSLPSLLCQSPSKLLKTFSAARNSLAAAAASESVGMLGILDTYWRNILQPFHDLRQVRNWKTHVNVKNKARFAFSFNVGVVIIAWTPWQIQSVVRDRSRIVPCAIATKFQIIRRLPN